MNMNIVVGIILAFLVAVGVLWANWITKFAEERQVDGGAIAAAVLMGPLMGAIWIIVPTDHPARDRRLRQYYLQ